MIDDLRARLREIASREMQSDPSHDVAHLDRVWKNAHEIASDETGADQKVLVAASYFHDLINLPKDSPDRHLASKQSASKAISLLRSLDFSEAEIKAVGHAIEAHSFLAGIPPQSLEAKIIRDADRLDAIGAIGIARWFAVSGQLNRSLYDPEDPFASNKLPNDSLFTLEHWNLKLSLIADSMLTAKGREIAQKRHKTMLSFLTTLRSEIT